jgi:catechol 2,3-dioxygenase-like lactoylglutathione lyase family enzyme
MSGAARRGREPDPKPFFSSVAVMVSDRARSVDWYTRRLGLEVIDSRDHWVTVGRRGRNGTIHLCQFSDLPDLALEPGETGIDLQIPGKFEDVCRALAARGVTFSRPATHRPWGWYAKVVDPDGNELRITPAEP